MYTASCRPATESDSRAPGGGSYVDLGPDPEQKTGWFRVTHSYIVDHDWQSRQAFAEKQIETGIAEVVAARVMDGRRYEVSVGRDIYPGGRSQRVGARISIFLIDPSVAEVGEHVAPGSLTMPESRIDLRPPLTPEQKTMLRLDERTFARVEDEHGRLRCWRREQ